MLWKRDKLFCDINPACYAISLQKERIKRNIRDFLSKETFAKTVANDKLPHIVSEHRSNMIKRAPGVNLTHQFNKAVNIGLAGNQINGLVIHPGEVFSFWKTVGKISKRKGYKEGRIIEKNRLVAGTSVFYHHIDYRFKNTTDQEIQLLVWCEGETLHAELRSEKPFPYRYELVEENHHFKKEGETFYRNSNIYRMVNDKTTNEQVAKELILENHSEVMFDYNLIPKELIRN